MFKRLFDILNLGRLPKVRTMQTDRQLKNETGFLHPSKEKPSRLFILCMHKLIWLVVPIDGKLASVTGLVWRASSY